MAGRLTRLVVVRARRAGLAGCLTRLVVVRARRTRLTFHSAGQITEFARRTQRAFGSAGHPVVRTCRAVQAFRSARHVAVFARRAQYRIDPVRAVTAGRAGLATDDNRLSVAYFRGREVTRFALAGCCIKIGNTCDRQRAIVASIARSVDVRICLGSIGRRRAVVTGIRTAVAVGIRICQVGCAGGQAGKYEIGVVVVRVVAIRLARQAEILCGRRAVVVEAGAGCFHRTGYRAFVTEGIHREYIAQNQADSIGGAILYLVGQAAERKIAIGYAGAVSANYVVIARSQIDVGQIHRGINCGADAVHEFQFVIIQVHRRIAYVFDLYKFLVVRTALVVIHFIYDQRSGITHAQAVEKCVVCRTATGIGVEQTEAIDHLSASRVFQTT